MFVFRNYTIENIFPQDTHFSGYDDISFIPNDDNTLVWFYQCPIIFDLEKRRELILSYKKKLEFIISQLKPGQKIYICTLIDFIDVNINDNNKIATNAISEFNNTAYNLELTNNHIHVIDVSEFFEKYPKSEWINWRFYFISQMIVSPSLANQFYSWFELRKSQIDGSRKKCLVLDLDNTLWGGVLGEDGVDGIKIGGDYPGNAFLYFQEALIELSKSGILLTICSKNNEEDVIEAWNKNPYIKLKKEYISAYRINWQNKADNIREIAKELNIGLDSMVFVDDNPSERELVKLELPMVEVPDFPKKTYDLVEFYQTLLIKYFRTYKLTSEDIKKTEQYKANAARSQECSKFSNMTEFIASLNINLTIQDADNFNIPRIAQMTQKTNQFNLTTKRYTEADIETMLKNGYKAFVLSVSDKFGDNGITGLMIVHISNEIAEIDTFLLSCRILGKGIENAFFNAVINKLLELGIKTVKSKYIPTQKNNQVANFYSSVGMTLEKEHDNEKQYSIQLENKTNIQQYYKIN